MVAICKGVCIQYKASKRQGGYRYENGQKMCSICGIFIKWEGIRCPCCSAKLRNKPKSTKNRKEFQEKRNCVWH